MFLLKDKPKVIISNQESNKGPCLPIFEKQLFVDLQWETSWGLFHESPFHSGFKDSAKRCQVH